MPDLCSDLVVVIPGLVGSVLSKDGKAIWGNSVGAAWRLVAGNALGILELNADDDERDDLEDGIAATGLVPNVQLIPGLWKLEGYSILAEKLINGMRLVRNENYREFAYDWRRSNRVSAKKLAAILPIWLKEWREKSGNSEAKVVFVVHSMGGLVARYFIECLEGWKTTRTLLSFGTPYRGSGNALGFLCNGFSWDIGPLKAFDGTEAIRSFDSVYQLLPIYPFIDCGDKELARVSELALPNLVTSRVLAAAAFHQEIRSAQEKNATIEAYVSNGPRVRPIVGIEQPTFQSATFDGKIVTMLKSHSGEDLKGDGTVPRVSAIPLEGSNASATYVATTHSALQSDEGAIGHVRGVLTETDVDPNKYRTTGTGRIGLSIQDAYSSHEPIEIAACLSEYVQYIAAKISRLDAAAPNKEVILRPRDVWHTASVLLPAGLYRLSVVHEDFHPVSDVFLVADD